MRVLIEYKARLTYISLEADGTHRHHEREMSSIKHEIDTETLETLRFDFEPLDSVEAIMKDLALAATNNSSPTPLPPPYTVYRDGKWVKTATLKETDITDTDKEGKYRKDMKGRTYDTY